MGNLRDYLKKQRKEEKNQSLVDRIMSCAMDGLNRQETAAILCCNEKTLKRFFQANPKIEEAFNLNRKNPSILAKRSLRKALEVDVEGKLSLAYLAKVDDEFSDKSINFNNITNDTKLTLAVELPQTIEFIKQFAIDDAARNATLVVPE